MHSDFSLDVFLGRNLYSNETLKSLSAFATAFTDVCFWQISRAYMVHTAKKPKAQHQVPNEALNFLYDKFIPLLHLPRRMHNGPLPNVISTIKAILWRCCCLAMLRKVHGDYWQLLWVLFMYQYKDARFPWIVQVLWLANSSASSELMTFSPKMLIPNQDPLQEQSNKEIAPTKESAQKGQRPLDSFRTDCSKWLHSSPFSGNVSVYSILRLAERPRASETKCMSRLRAPNSVCLVLSRRWAGMAMDVLFCECSEQNWAMSAIARNRQAHITNGNQFCQQCGLFLGHMVFH